MSRLRRRFENLWRRITYYHETNRRFWNLNKVQPFANSVAPRPRAYLVVVVCALLALAVINTGVIVFAVPERWNGLDPIVVKPLSSSSRVFSPTMPVGWFLVKALVCVFCFPDASFHAYEFNGIVLKLLNSLVRLVAKKTVIGTFG